VRPAARVVPLAALQTSDRRHARIFTLSRPAGNARTNIGRIKLGVAEVSRRLFRCVAGR
jgi:hypothetical protein